MAEQQSPDYKKLWLEEQRRCEAAEQAQTKEQRRREAAEQAQTKEQRRREAAEDAQQQAEQALGEEQRRREAAEEKSRKTTLPEFLDACHHYLYSGLAVQTDMTQSTRGDPANAHHKLRPDKLLLWKDFPEQQLAIWNDLIESDFVLQRYFTSLNSLEESGEAIRRRMLSSELDLNFFQRYTVEDHVSLIIEKLYDTPTLRQKFRLQGSIKFENHANTLSPESQLQEGMEKITVSETRRRSPRLLAKGKGAELADSTEPAERAVAARIKTAPLSRPRADQFCVYNNNTRNGETRTLASIIEFKAPHKLPLGCINEGLEDMKLEDVIQQHETETPRDRFRRLIAAVITQAFSYMVSAGLVYGCVCTGEATIFLWVPDDPRTVHYFLSVPKGDVGDSTGWASNSDGENRLHLTAVGQMLAFTLQALKTPTRGQRWQAEAAAQLNSWEVVYDDLLDTILLEDVPSSEYRPPRHNKLLRMSPIQLRQRPNTTSSSSSCRPQDEHEISDEESDPDTPSRQPSSHQPSSSQHMSRTRAAADSSSPSSGSRRGQKSGRYCTQNCLLGLVKGSGSVLDMSCPNARDHGEIYHKIDQSTFLTGIRQQLSEDLDTNCMPVCPPGSCGVLFQVRLKSHGYVVAAKCTPKHFVSRLQSEAIIYQQLCSIQGIYVPVYLGNIDLETPYYYEGICELVHMMFLSFGGERISQRLPAENKQYINQQIYYSTQAVYNLGVRHNDLEARNLLWDNKTGKVMVIDFERAEVIKPRIVLGPISANRKSRESETSPAKQGENRTSVFAQEEQQMAIEFASPSS